MDTLAIIRHFYPEDTPLRRRLLRHSEQVRDKALALAANSAETLDLQLVADGAMLHDIGIIACDAPGIDCRGAEPYLAHGVIGARMLREYGAAHGLDLEKCARICERHTGSGLAAEEIRAQKLPLPERDYLPESAEEALVCLADKFFSKSGGMEEKPLKKIRRSLEKFGDPPLARFEELCRRFKVE
ncbi:MAG: HD domain-containing protein [Lentisphaeria bacterium]|nr:HD domain-containing protein [Lentisphaeria bacterium]